MGENIYFFMVIALAILAITDLVVGVSNDAVNFLNSAIGSKAISFRTIMIVASLGIGFGALSSSGMMEVARKGIFNPSEFMFSEIMIIFMAVMITDILLLDFFNTLGMPTSTTVSIVFELLGASVAISLVKIYAANGSIGELIQYINTAKATEIIFGILLSVIVAFSVGAIVQFISRVLISFKFEHNPKWVEAIFGGLAASAIIYFIMVKGLNSASIIPQDILNFIGQSPAQFICLNILIWTIICLFYSLFLNGNVYKMIIVVGTFALAMAFAGNDLVNFIGVPIAAFQAYETWTGSGMAAESLPMVDLSRAVQTPTLLLLASGLIMIVTLWFSSKAKSVVKTSVDLSRQDEGEERFQPNFLSRQIVKLSSAAFDNFLKIIPKNVLSNIDLRYELPAKTTMKVKSKDAPAFDLVRAAVNLMVASVLISLATSKKLPLSTTYVTFMVAMGTSLADRAWGFESAVYRVAGVLNVIGGWFFTAISAFIAAALIAYLLHLGGFWALVLLLLLAIALISRNYQTHRAQNKVIQEKDSLRRAQSSSVQGVMHESAENLGNLIQRTNKIYSLSVNGLGRHNLDILKKGKKAVEKLTKEIEALQNSIFYFINNLDEKSVGNASNFYINLLGHLQDVSQSLEYIFKSAYNHVNNNHSKLKYTQIKELLELDRQLGTLLDNTIGCFQKENFADLGPLTLEMEQLNETINQIMEKQISRTRLEESSPKNTRLFFSLLTESKDIVKALKNILELFYSEHDSTIEPAKPVRTRRKK